MCNLLMPTLKHNFLGYISVVHLFGPNGLTQLHTELLGCSQMNSTVSLPEAPYTNKTLHASLHSDSQWQ